MSSDAVATWRQYYRRLRWNKGRVALRRPLLVAHAILWPLRAAIACTAQTLRIGPAARRMSGASLARQFIEQWWLCVRVGCRPDSYYKFRLYMPDRRGRGAEFIHEPEALAVLRKINDVPQFRTLDDKHAFADACRTLGLPHVATEAYFVDGKLVEGQVPRAELFVKCTNLLCGRGVERWTWEDAEGVYQHQQQKLTPAALIDHLAESSRAQPAPASENKWRGTDGKLITGPRPYLVQRRVENHPDLAVYSNGPLCTVRIVTARAAGAPPQFILGSLRMPARGSNVDNFAAGGIAAPIDSETGTLGVAVSKDPTLPPTEIHPDRNMPIAGRKVPFWSEAKTLCLRAHGLFNEVATVGWDVAITPDGPRLLEANPVWCVELIQMSHGKPLGETRLAELCVTHVR